MKIKYISEQDLLSLKANCATIYKELIIKKNNDLSKLMDKKELFKESNIEIKDFKLDMSKSKEQAPLTDLENIKRVYNNMRGITDTVASDERIWVALALTDYYEYMIYRWEPKKEEDLKNRFFFNYSEQRSLFRNGLARLYWIGKVTYDKQREDPFELTSFLCRDQDYIENLCGRNIFNNQNVIIPTIAALCDSEKEGIKINRDVVRNITKYINILSGVFLVDALSQNEIYTKIKTKIANIKQNVD